MPDQSRSRGRRRAIALIQALWIGALAVALVWFARTNAEAFGAAVARLDLAWVPAILALETGRRFIGSWRWAYLANGARWGMAASVYWAHARVFFISNMFGYIPLVFATAVTRVELYKRIGVRRMETAGLHVAESALLALSSLPLMALALPLLIELDPGLVAASVIGTAAVCVVALHPVLLERVFRLIGRPNAERLSFVASVTLLGFGVTAKVLSGVLLLLVLRAFGVETTADQAAVLIGLVAGAWLIGALAVWAPAGLGVRDGVLALGLLAVAPPEVAVLVSITVRVASLIPDLALGALGATVGRSRPAMAPD